VPSVVTFATLTHARAHTHTHYPVGAGGSFPQQ